MEQKALNELGERLRALLAQSPAADLEKNLKALLGRYLAQLDLVGREEFDIQRAVLLRTREKLEKLEAQVAALEASAGRTPPG
jgi:BMFP domain-containing protein YqiC